MVSVTARPHRRGCWHLSHLLLQSRWKRMSPVSYELRISDVRITICSSQRRQLSEIKRFFLRCSRHCACPSTRSSDVQGWRWCHLCFFHKISKIIINDEHIFRCLVGVILLSTSYGSATDLTCCASQTGGTYVTPGTDLNPTPRLG